MEKFVSFLIRFVLLALGLTIGYLVGNNKGYEKGLTDGNDKAKLEQKSRNIDEIKSELKTREDSIILSYLTCSVRIERKDEGSLFTVKYVQYLTGTLTNSATIAIAKDVKLKVLFYSKTDSEIGSQEITVYEYLRPGQSVNFKERVNVPEKVAELKFKIIEAKPTI